MNNENLKEAIGKYIESKELVLMAYPPEYIEDVKKDMEIAFRAGAEWTAGQGDTIDGQVVNFFDGIAVSMGRLVVNDGRFKVGDKVIVQIRKKEE